MDSHRPRIDNFLVQGVGGAIFLFGWFFGCFCVLVYVGFADIGNRSQQRTRHLISGTQSELLYLYQMLNRVMHGHTVNDARIEIENHG